MQWNLYRTFEAVARLGSLTLAAKALGLSQSTVSRQLDRLEEMANSPLLLRTSPLRLTDRGRILLDALGPMVDASLMAEAALQNTFELKGEVRLTTVGEVIRWVLLDHLEDFYARHPHLRLVLLADNQIQSLATGDVDLALRLIRPTRGDLVAQKVGQVDYGFYAAESLALGPQSPWLTLAGGLSDIAEQKYARDAFIHRAPRLAVEDYESLGLAVERGLGVAVLAHDFAQGLDGVTQLLPHQVGARDLGPIAPREIWMVVHRSKQHLPKIRAVMHWLAGAIRSGRRPFSPIPAPALKG